jgi:allophanate hydrolase subunit 2
MSGYATVLSKYSVLSFQDKGRGSWISYGIPRSGPMDCGMYENVNRVLCNGTDATVLEIGPSDLKIEFHYDAIICLGAISSKAFINERSIDLFSPISISSHSILHLPYSDGWKYLAVKGGWQPEVRLGSRSTYGLLGMEKIGYKSILPYDLNHDLMDFSLINDIEIEKEVPNEIIVHKGFDHHLLDKNLIHEIEHKKYTIDKGSNRQAYILSSDWMPSLPIPNIVSSVVYPGTVQLTPSGKLYIMMPDCQVTGGYVRIGQLDQASLDHLVRKNIGEEISLKFC